MKFRPVNIVILSDTWNRLKDIKRIKERKLHRCVSLDEVIRELAGWERKSDKI